ncbi:MAG: hypothetical protein HC849_17975 [Oscillatoriales cyanobacterium RU_3_3]|nr:hypothetical protein [Microcoleus sp. SU_5_6]NJL68261.1 hypothetical protein [Microcoleus sp. SM1_3_4]NJM61652.1 hypothetical protein [Oscillatoriales cyanobacterium RU_3_3]NJR21042.1 hypothetical protein [Richelia sp. CSU_2_1]
MSGKLKQSDVRGQAKLPSPKMSNDLPITNYQLPITNYQPPIINYVKN